MNHYTLAAESRRWWMPSAAAGVAATSAILMIALVPANGYASEPRDQRPAVGVPATDSTGYRPCYLVRPHGNLAPEGPPVRCVLRTR